MKELPKNQLDPRIKNVWRISDFIWITILYACCVVAFPLIALFSPADAWWAWTVALIMTGIWLLMIIIWLVILPPIRYARWRYEMSDDFLDIARGIIWRKRFIIPFIRVQNTDTKQGPVLRAFGLSSVTVSTAAGEHEIPGVAAEESEQLRDRAAELARIAQEDV